MKLSQNAKDIVLIELDGVGLLLGEVRYNRQTETASFALEKASFFDLYLPCTVVYDQQRGPLVHPHILSTFTTSSLRIQRNRVSFFILEPDINPVLVEQYNSIKATLKPRTEPGQGEIAAQDKRPSEKKKVDKKKVINIHALKDRSKDLDKT
ncbi:MAG: hypothetical protein ACUVQV_00090 [Dissulfurimicrobium sp.]|uniref:hypothetical protein n=1 Tax=Dissulfurimicrobium sp. TaxID=2022436 RepID=UPI00404A3466